eukprot:COSAG01_NODE_42330_length_441_cov_0.824561_1_plen_67_part_01
MRGGVPVNRRGYKGGAGIMTPELGTWSGTTAMTASMSGSTRAYQLVSTDNESDSATLHGGPCWKAWG